MENFNEKGFVNVGYGEDISIKDLAYLIKEVVGFEGELVFDESKPDGAPRKLMDNSKINNMGWSPKISLKEGVSMVYDDVKNQPFFN